MASDPTLLWLDDRRPPPSTEWTWVTSTRACVHALRSRSVRVLHLDYDLHPGRSRRTGLDVLRWLLREVKAGRAVPPELRVHSRNPEGRAALRQLSSVIAAAYEEARCKIMHPTAYGPQEGEPRTPAPAAVEPDGVEGEEEKT